MEAMVEGEVEGGNKEGVKGGNTSQGGEETAT